MLCGMTRFGLFVIGALRILTPKMFKLRCLYYTFWPQIGSNQYSASSFEFSVNSLCFLQCRESLKCFHIPLKACTKGQQTFLPIQRPFQLYFRALFGTYFLKVFLELDCKGKKDPCAEFGSREDKGREGIPHTHPIPQLIRLELFLESG